MLHENRTCPLTGSDALTFGDVAAILSDVLGRDITYRSPFLPSFIRRLHAHEHPLGFALVTGAIYTAARLGIAGGVTPDIEVLLG